MANTAVGGLIFVLLFAAALYCLAENEKRAAGRFFLWAWLVPAPFLLIHTLPTSWQFITGLGLISLLLISLIVFILPTPRPKPFSIHQPMNQNDERDTIFARNDLIMGTANYEDYYRRHPDKKVTDDAFRALPGLLSPEAGQHHPLAFAAAQGSFSAVTALKPLIDGQPVSDTLPLSPETMTLFIKNWAKKLGAVDVGITPLQKYHLYRFKGRKETYGQEVRNDHRFAIAFTVEMQPAMIRPAPAASTVMESAQQYFHSGAIAVQVAAFIRELGYRARAHIDGNYQVVCPLVAQDAGLGTIGRMGLLMTPRLGPRVRISVVTTDLPLLTDDLNEDTTTVDFCRRCQKCARACPAQAIPFEDMAEIDGVKRWRINSEACFTFWCKVGTDCSRCLVACPYSHADNLMHRWVRRGIGNSAIFRRTALALDDYFYGKLPLPTSLPGWMREV